MAEAASWLDPPLSEEQLTGLARALRLRPAGYRARANAGRRARTYDAGLLMILHALLLPWVGAQTPADPVRRKQARAAWDSAAVTAGRAAELRALAETLIREANAITGRDPRQ